MFTTAVKMKITNKVIKNLLVIGLMSFVCNVASYADKRRFEIVTDSKTNESKKIYYNGKKTHKYSDGRVGIETYKEGILDGLSSLTRSSGKMNWIKNYKEGKLHGINKRFYYEGQLLSTDQYQNGVRTGEYKIFFKNGKLKEKGYRKNGKLHGTQYRYGTYDKDPEKIKHSSHYVMGEKSGSQKSFFKDGSLESMENYRIDKSGRSIRHGKFIHYSGKSKPRSISFYVDGKQHGLAQTYHYSGKLASERCYVNGSLQDSFKTCKNSNDLDNIMRKTYANGKLKIEYQIKSGQYHGFYKKYSKKGRLEFVQYYKEGKKHGKFIAYYMNKKPKKISFFKENKLDGSYKSFHGNGKLCDSLTYISGKRDGKAKHYDDKGVLLSEVNYKKGRKDGVEKIYKDKKVVAQNIYKKGRLASSKKWDAKGKFKSSKVYYEDGSEKLTK